MRRTVLAGLVFDMTVSTRLWKPWWPELDITRLAGSDRLAGIVAHGAAATRAHATDDQRCIARIGEMEGIGHHFALEQGTEVVLFLVESDDGLLVGGLRG